MNAKKNQEQCDHKKTVEEHIPARMEDGVFHHAIDEVVCLDCRKSWSPIEADCPRKEER